MKLYYPKYYKDFSCIADRCPDSCCHEWEVDVDEETAAYYRQLPGPLGARLREVLRDTGEGVCMTVEAGRCPMWRQDGLCRIQAELGHDALCHTCRTFPRLRHDYGCFQELGLELSCPEAARLILSADASVCQAEKSGQGEADYEQPVMAALLASREHLRRFLEETDHSVPQILAVVLLYAHQVQAQIDGAEPAPFDPAQALRRANSFPLQAGEKGQLLDFFKGLEILTQRWRQRLEQPEPGRWAREYRQLIRYFLDRYWLQAVSDYDLVCRAKLIVAACLLLHSLGGDLPETAQLFSKEIENDRENVEALLDGAYTSPALTDLHLLSLLLNGKEQPCDGAG